MRPPRVAYFPDSFHEVNGVAHTSRNFVAFAQRHHLPFLCVRAALGTGSRTPVTAHHGSVSTLELPRSSASVRLEKDLSFDPLFWRHHDAIADALHRFRPDLIHLTGPSELGIFAASFATRLGIPLAASWHTNVHEYASRRLDHLTSRLPTRTAATTSSAVERLSLLVAARLYALAQVLYAPNPPLCELLAAATRRPCHLMQRGVDTDLFSPAHRQSPPATTHFTLGYVGRLSVEKNVALLPLIQHQLQSAGISAHFLIIGHGDQEAALRRDLPQSGPTEAEFAGVLRGLDLSRAYARMDLLVFPSHTDTFGNVVLEALASGVPAIVTPSGGPRYIVRDAASTQLPGQPETGIIAPDAGFAPAIASLLRDPARRAAMAAAARAYALTCTWDAVFTRVYNAYPTPSHEPS